MGNAFMSLGILCIVYYIVIWMHTKRRNATFSSFWLLFGLTQTGIGLILGRIPGWGQLIIQILLVISFLLFFAIEIVILSGMLTLPKDHLDVIIVLGACIRGREITGALKRRLDQARTYLEENPNTVAIVSGGQGKGEDVTEAFAMREYLVEQGIAEDRIVMEENATSTQENLEFSKQLLRKGQNTVGIVTNQFHMYRAMKYARALGYEKVYGIMAGCDIILFFNYMVREFFAVLQMYFRFGRNRKKSQ